MNRKIYLVLLGCLVAFSSAGQSAEELLQKAKGFYDQDQSREALYYLNKYLKLDSSNAEVYKMRGNCQLDMNQVKKAMQDYQKAIKIDSNYYDAYYNLGNGMEELKNYDSAAYFFKKCIGLDPDNPDGYSRLALNLQTRGKTDSIRYLLEKAYNLDTANVLSVQALMQQYFYAGEYEKSIMLSKQGQSLLPEEMSFYLFYAMAATNLGLYEEAIQQSEAILLLDSTNIDALNVGMQAQRLMLTPAALLSAQPDGTVTFTTYTSENMQSLLKAGELAHFDSLKSRMLKGEMLGLSDYFIFYLAQKDQDGFSPYFIKSDPDIASLYQKEDFVKLATYGDRALATYPVKLDDLYRVAVANYAIHNMQEFKRIYAIYSGVLVAILATGNGRSTQTAYIVMSTSDEYSLLNYLGLQSTQQALINKNGHSYDMLTATVNGDNKQEIYFNIDVPFGSLSHSLSGGKVKKKKRKKK